MKSIKNIKPNQTQSTKSSATATNIATGTTSNVLDSIDGDFDRLDPIFQQAYRAHGVHPGWDGKVAIPGTLDVVQAAADHIRRLRRHNIIII